MNRAQRFAIAFGACFALSARAETNAEKIKNVEHQVESTFGSGTPLSQAMNNIAQGPVLREIISYSPLGTTLFLEEPDSLNPDERIRRRETLLEKLSAITQTPFEVIDLTEPTFCEAQDCKQMKQRFVARLMPLLKNRNENPLHIAFILPDLTNSPLTLGALKLIDKMIDDGKFEIQKQIFHLEDVEFIFFAETHPDRAIPSDDLPKFVEDHLHFPANFISRVRQISTINLGHCESQLIQKSETI